MDELGRGTATFDGTAIAHAVVDYLVQKIRCRSLFATHYHSLVDDWEIDPRVRLGHMDCLVDSPDSKTSETATEEITFLYKLSDGSSPKSYGINVAKLAGLPDDVIVIALQQSKLFEDKMNTIRDSTDGSDGNSFVSRGQKEKLVSLFERLVLISHSSGSSMTVHELAYIAGELWRRYNSVKDV